MSKVNKAGKIIYNFVFPFVMEYPMQAYELRNLLDEREASGKLYLEFFKVPDLSMGLYVLPAGSRDPQSPHTEDEVYYVISGRARILVADEDQEVQAGSIVYVAKNIAHHFHSIEEDLTVLVLFAPAEYANRPQA
jgi:mannose-6-phosphate isomerase-like protein (cupin superfamily)